MRSPTVAAVALVALIAGCDRPPPPPAGALHEAIVLRDAARVDALLEAGADPNAPDALGLTPLMSAAAAGWIEAAEALLAAGADVNAHGPERRTALLYALESNQDSMFERLAVRPDIDLDARGRQGTTALVETVAKRRLDLAALLLEHGAAIDAPGPHGRTPLLVAAMTLDGPTIAWLLERGADPAARCDDRLGPLHYAAMCPAPLDAIIDDGAATFDALLAAVDAVDDPGAGGMTPLHLAAYYAHPWINERLLDAGADPFRKDDHGRLPVCYVAVTEPIPFHRPDDALAIIDLHRAHGVTGATEVDEAGHTLADIERMVQARRR